MDITFEEDIPQLGRQNAEELLTGGPRSSVEAACLRKNGEVLWITRTACLMRDVDGDPRDFLVMVEDISERKAGGKGVVRKQTRVGSGSPRQSAHHG